MENIEIRQKLLSKGIKHYELAEMLKISEWTLSRKLRKELQEDERKKVLDVIESAGKGC